MFAGRRTGLPRRARPWLIGALLFAAVAPGPPVLALGSKPPTSVVLVRAQRTSYLTVSGSCTPKEDAKLPPSLDAVLTAWDLKATASRALPLNLRPVLVDEKPTGEFIFTAAVLLADLQLDLEPLAGRLLFTSADCESVAIGVLLEDTLGHLPPVAVHVLR